MGVLRRAAPCPLPTPCRSVSDSTCTGRWCCSSTPQPSTHTHTYCYPLPRPLQTFPGSDWVTSQAALAHYNCRNFDTAQALYEDLLERDPWRLQVSGGGYQGVGLYQGRRVVGNWGLYQV